MSLITISNLDRGLFVNASVVSLVFLLPPSPSPMSFVYIISKKKKKSNLEWKVLEIL